MSDSLDIIFTAPHPDDIEIGSGGTIAKLVKLGYNVGMVHMTSGEPTPRGTLETRRKEAAAAAEVLGVKTMLNLDLPNRVLMDGPEARYALATAVRRYKPRILVGMHGRTVAASPDHYQAQLITEAARFHSQLTKWDERFDGTPPHRVDHLWYRPVARSAENASFASTFVVDITETIEIKIAAVKCYESQFNTARFEKVEHYIRGMAAFDGGGCGFDYGELYALPRALGVDDPMKLFEEFPVPAPFSPKYMQ